MHSYIKFFIQHIRWCLFLTALIWSVMTTSIYTYLSSPTIRMGSLGLNSTCVSLVFFFWATICSHRGSYLLMFRSYTNIWKKNNKYFKYKNAVCFDLLNIDDESQPSRRKSTCKYKGALSSYLLTWSLI